jgi:parallel beta-helix repeat protein
MKKRMMEIMCCLVFGGAFLLLLPSIGLSQCTVSVGAYAYPSIQLAINSATSSSATSPVTIYVTGTCNENLYIYESKNWIHLTVPTGQTATITGANPNSPTITTIGKGITIDKFTIKGGVGGIQVVWGGTAFIENNIIETEGEGIIVALNSYAVIRGNTIQDNPINGIVVSDSSFARIGIRSNLDAAPISNTIQGNAYGVTIARSSSAQIIGNTISSNTHDGVRVVSVSQADISNNTIDGNNGNGIFVTQNSGVNLGKDTGDTMFDLPNTTNLKNGLFGLQGTIGGYADGRLGTLDGCMGRAFFDLRSINSTRPWLW